MKKNKQVDQFERIAFESALREHPGDRNAADAFRDWLEDHDYTHLGALRIVTRTIREATEQKQADRVKQRFEQDADYAFAVRLLLGDRCPMRSLPSMNIEIQPGGQRPMWCLNGMAWVDGDDNIYEFIPSGQEYTEDVRYVPAVDCVKVGAAWLLNLFQANGSDDELRRHRAGAAAG